MTFTFEVAKAIVEHYKYLIGRSFEKTPTDYKITHLLIVPSSPEQFEVFINVFNQTGNNQDALYKSGCDKSKMRVLLTHRDTWGGNIFTSDIDKYLTRMGIEKIYPNHSPSGDQNQ